MSLLIGIDGGGTRTRAVAVGADLVARGRGAAGPSNGTTTPLPRLLETVCEAADDALVAAGATRRDATLLACGLAGVEGTGAGARIEAALAAEFPSSRVLVVTDARAALAGASPEGPDAPGVVLIAGTGAVAFGRRRDGEEARAGGWGPLIGDEGSAYFIARRGLAAVVRSLDGRGPGTILHDLLFASEGSSSTAGLLRKLYRPGVGPSEIAAYFPLVLEAARRRDRVSLAIFREAAAELGLAVRTVVERLSLGPEPFPVATVGGVFNAGAILLDPLAEELRAIPAATLGPPAFPPEVGAVRLLLSRGHA